MDKKRLDIIIFALATILVLFFVLKDDFKGIVDILLNANVLYILLAIILFVASDALKAVGLYVAVKPFDAGYKFRHAYKLNLIADFFNGITPFCAGGEPYQVYYLGKKHNINYAKGTSIVFQNFFMRQVALITICSIAIIINEIHTFIPLDPFLNNLVLLGNGLNIIITIILFAINIDRKGKSSLIKKFFTFLYNKKLIKEKILNRVIGYMDNFYESQKYIKETKHIPLKIFISYSISFIFMFMVPIMVFNAIDVSVQLPTFSYIISTIYVYILCGFVPIPGGTAGYEFGFITFFGFFLKGSILKVGMLLWRFVTFYLLVIIGAIIFLIDRKE